ncbi:toll/interleukin-1 receptor domain-containing protein [Pedococcus soli]
MKVFISWSGTRSKKTAALLYKWLPQIINEIDPWMSDKDLKSGGDWGGEIRDALEQAKFGIICVTPGNRRREWLQFEAGALSRRVDDAPNRVAPFLIGFESKSDLPMPLARFQSTEPTREDMKKLLLSMNEECLKPRTVEQIDDALDHYWDSFAVPFEEIRSSVTEHTGDRRTDRQVLDDILAAVRGLESRGSYEHVDEITQAARRRIAAKMLENAAPPPVWSLDRMPDSFSRPSKYEAALRSLGSEMGFQITTTAGSDRVTEVGVMDVGDPGSLTERLNHFTNVAENALPGTKIFIYVGG